MSIKILEAGIASSVQDLGRFGYFDLGLTQGGPMDLARFQWVNRLLGNNTNSSQIEIFYGGLTFIALHPVVICVGAPKAKVLVDDQPINLWQTFNVRKGQTVRIDYFDKGRVGYLGVSGGFDVTKTYGSVSSVAREEVGGLNGGDVLKSGDVLTCLSSHFTHHYTLPNSVRFGRDTKHVRVVTGYQYADFSPAQRAVFFSSEYTITDQVNRMGMQLAGPLIKPAKTNLYSEGIALGAIQITNLGQPIILLNDRQTIGGYPKIGSVFSLDLSRLIQTSAGESVTFCPISVEQAHNALHLRRAFDSRSDPFAL